MKQKIGIKHKDKNRTYCNGQLYIEFWGGDDHRLTCYLCGFARIINKEEFTNSCAFNEIE